jgi:hypothetical protein
MHARIVRAYFWNFPLPSKTIEPNIWNANLRPEMEAEIRQTGAAKAEYQINNHVAVERCFF